MKNMKVPEGMIINHKDRIIYVTEALHKKIGILDLSDEELEAVYYVFKKYTDYKKSILHFIWLDENN